MHKLLKLKYNNFKLKKIGIVTKVDNCNCGNRLQNYALSYFLNKNFNNFAVETLNNNGYLNNRNDSKLKNHLKRIKYFYLNFEKIIFDKKYNKFKNFNKKINFSLKLYDIYHMPKDSDYDFIIIGSDQVWNYNFDIPDLFFGTFKKNNVCSYSASFGVDNIPKNLQELYITNLNNLKYISVREDSGKKIIESLINKNNVKVLVDPTMLLTVKEWDMVAKKPKNFLPKRYIFNYFLGSLSNERKKEIERVAQENECELINFLDKNDKYYDCGPAEFLYLEKNAYLICTDSFHSSVFAIIYNRPFIVFEREQNGLISMNSRLDTLISKFNLKDRICKDNIIKKENITCDYSYVSRILLKEREKSLEFLKECLQIKDSD